MKYRFIDHIRGIAILMVILVHTSQSINLPEGWLLILAEYGQMGVQLFFVASAYTLCLSWEARRGERHAVTNFFIRRFFRIAPVYYLGIVVYFLFRTFIGYLDSGQLSAPEQYTVVNVLANIFFVHGAYFPANNNIVPGGWSIGTEMLFYSIFPMLFYIVSLIRHHLYLVVLLPIIGVLVSSVTIALSGYPAGNNGFIYFSILNQFSVFLAGISLYLIHAHFNWLALKFNVGLLLFYFALFSLISIWLGWIASPDWGFMFVPFLSAIAFLPLVELFKRMNFTGLGLLEKIGQRSYSMYIIHFIFAYKISRTIYEEFLSAHFSPEVALMLCLIMTIVASYFFAGLLSQYVEKVFIQKGKLLIIKLSEHSIQKTSKTATD